jgi:hypothetical protein
MDWTRLADDVEPVAEQQVVVAVYTSLPSQSREGKPGKNASTRGDSNGAALDSWFRPTWAARTPNEFSMGNTARSTRNCSTAYGTVETH